MVSTTILSNDDLDRLTLQYPEIGEDRCPTCRGEGYYYWLGERHTCHCQRQKELHIAYCHAGIGLKYQRMTWDDMNLTAEQLQPFYDYLSNLDAYLHAGVGLFVSGEVGTGKTLAINLVLKEAVKRGYDCYYSTFVKAVDQFTSTWYDDEDKRRFARRFEITKVLGLDDLGKEFANRASTHTLDRILRERNQQCRPLLTTSNYQAWEVSANYGAGVLSLLAEQSVHIHLSGSDFRPSAHQRTLTEVASGEARPIE